MKSWVRHCLLLSLMVKFETQSAFGEVTSNSGVLFIHNG